MLGSSEQADGEILRKPVLGGRMGDRQAQLQVRIRTSRCRDPETIIAEQQVHERVREIGPRTRMGMVNEKGVDTTRTGKAEADDEETRTRKRRSSRQGQS